MARVVYSPLAVTDLREMAEYIAQDDPQAAKRLYDKIVEQCRRLAQMPLVGRSRPDLAPNVRSLVVYPYLVIFRQIDDGIEIVRVVHGKRDVASLFSGSSPDGDPDQT